MHGLIGGCWGQQATTSEIRRRTKVTTLHWATVSRRCIQSLNQRPTSHHQIFLGNSSRGSEPVIAEDREHDAGRTCWWEGSQTEL
jgi:hypothetical protein